MLQYYLMQWCWEFCKCYRLSQHQKPPRTPASQIPRGQNTQSTVRMHRLVSLRPAWHQAEHRIIAKVPLADGAGHMSPRSAVTGAHRTSCRTAHLVDAAAAKAGCCFISELHQFLPCKIKLLWGYFCFYTWDVQWHVLLLFLFTSPLQGHLFLFTGSHPFTALQSIKEATQQNNTSPECRTEP